MSEFRTADGLEIHLEALQSEGKRVLFGGTTGAGKTNSMLIFARELLRFGWTIGVLDPNNNFRKLRDAGLPVIVAGARKSADVPLTNTAALAQYSFQQRVSVVLDTSLTEAEQDAAIVYPFLQQLWALVKAQDEDGPFTPYALFIDEAQEFIPQGTITDVTQIVRDITKRGRQFHLMMVVSSQRLASIDKNYVTLAHLRITHKLNHIDVEKFAKEFGMKPNDAKALMRNFVKGQAIVAGDKDVVNLGDEDYVVCQIDEFGGHATPQAAFEVAEARRLDESVLAALRKALEHAPPDTTGLDALRQRDEAIRKLRADNLRLEMEVKQKPRPEIQRIEVSLLKDEHVADLRATAERCLAAGQLRVEEGQSLIGMGQEILLQLRSVRPQPVPAAQPARRTVQPPVRTENGDMRIKSGARRMLKALAQRYPRRFTREELAVLSCFNADGGGFSTYLSTLRTRGFLDEQGGLFTVTAAVLEFVQDDPPMPQTTSTLLDMWKPKLKGKTKNMLVSLANVYPSSLTRQQLADYVEMEASGGGFSTYLSILRSNNLVTVQGQDVRASDALFVDTVSVERNGL